MKNNPRLEKRLLSWSFSPKVQKSEGAVSPEMRVPFI